MSDTGIQKGEEDSKGFGHKCQVQGEESFIDALFVVFSQGYLVEAIRRFTLDNGYTSKVRPSVLDLGCYNGRLMKFLVQRWTFVNYIGVDVRQDYIDQSVVKNRKKDTKMICADVTKGLPLDNGSQDMVVSSEVLEHIEPSKIPAVLVELARVTRKCGVLCLGFPMNTRERTFHKVENETNVGHLGFPVHEDFIEMAAEAGLELVRFDNSMSLKSSYRFGKETKADPQYQKLVRTHGSQIARNLWLGLVDEQTGGGFYTFTKTS